MNTYSYIEMLMQTINDVIDTARLLSNPTRVCILLALHTKGELCVNEIAEEVSASQSATSHQLANLESQEVVQCFRDGQRVCYILTDSVETKQIMNIVLAVSA